MKYYIKRDNRFCYWGGSITALDGPHWVETPKEATVYDNKDWVEYVASELRKHNGIVKVIKLDEPENKFDAYDRAMSVL